LLRVVPNGLPDLHQNAQPICRRIHVLVPFSMWRYLSHIWTHPGLQGQFCVRAHRHDDCMHIYGLSCGGHSGLPALMDSALFLLCFHERAAIAQTYELSPAAAIGMAVGVDIAPTHPAVIQTSVMRAAVAGGIDLAATPSGQQHAGWRRTRDLRMRPDSLRTRFTSGLVRDPCK
jgi:hypothetical protein